ncbi:MAG: hypothetical protein WC830_00520 [Burkholderiales bacterium]|jgi:hypothetical protein
MTEEPKSATPLLPTIDLTALNQKQLQKKASKAKEAAIAMRQHLWPDVTDAHLWLLDEKTRKGFAQIPRILPLLMNIISDVSKRVSGKSVPAGRTYLVLWCRVFSEGFVKIDSEAAAALEAGYSGERNVTTWREHVRVLKELGFIDFKEGPSGPTQYILLFNPYAVVKELHAKRWLPQNQYTALFQRATDIGAGSELK